MISHIVELFQGGSHTEPDLSPNLPISPPKTRLEQIVMYAYFSYTLILALSLALYLFGEVRIATLVVLGVTGLHFAMGFILYITGATSLKSRYEFEWECGDAEMGIGFRGSVTLLSDFFIMPVALATSIIALVLFIEHEGEDFAHLAYGAAIASAAIGNAICNLLHVT